jgi:polyhydroxyalkanoate synthesis regulator phasin
MEKSKDPVLQALDAVFAVTTSLIQNATNQLRDFSNENVNVAVPDFDIEELIEREGLVRQDELVRLRAHIQELRTQVIELEQETKKLKKKLKEFKEKL